MHPSNKINIFPFSFSDFADLNFGENGVKTVAVFNLSPDEYLLSIDSRPVFAHHF